MARLYLDHVPSRQPQTGSAYRSLETSLRLDQWTRILEAGVCLTAQQYFLTTRSE